jgi:hypothetical protein
LVFVDGAHRTGPDTDGTFIAVLEEFYPRLVKEHGVLGTCPDTGPAVHARSFVHKHRNYLADINIIEK